MKKDILVAGLAILGIYFIVNGLTSALSRVISLSTYFKLLTNPSVHMADGIFNNWRLILDLVVTLIQVVIGAALLRTRVRTRLSDLLSKTE